MRDEFSPEEFALDDDAVGFGGGFGNEMDEEGEGAEPIGEPDDEELDDGVDPMDDQDDL